MTSQDSPNDSSYISPVMAQRIRDEMATLERLRAFRLALTHPDYRPFEPALIRWSIQSHRRHISLRKFDNPVEG